MNELCKQLGCNYTVNKLTFTYKICPYFIITWFNYGTFDTIWRFSYDCST